MFVCLTKSYWVLLGLTGSYPVSQGLTGSHRVLFGRTGFLLLTVLLSAHFQKFSVLPSAGFFGIYLFDVDLA